MISAGPTVAQSLGLWQLVQIGAAGGTYFSPGGSMAARAATSLGASRIVTAWAPAGPDPADSEAQAVTRDADQMTRTRGKMR